MCILNGKRYYIPVPAVTAMETQKTLRHHGDGSPCLGVYAGEIGNSALLGLTLV